VSNRCPAASQGGHGNLVGIVSEGDFLRRAETGTGRRRLKWTEFLLGLGRLAQEYVQISGRKVRDVITEEVWAVEVWAVKKDAPLEDVVRLMERRRVKRVPVVEGGKIIGIVTRAICFTQWLVSSARSRRLQPETREIHCRTGTATVVPATRIDVNVRNCVVRLSGILTDERRR
jgi:CBS-domain-containing membrane protein